MTTLAETNPLHAADTAARLLRRLSNGLRNGCRAVPARLTTRTLDERLLRDVGLHELADRDLRRLGLRREPVGLLPRLF
jgi:hypothetical protein